MSEKSKEADAEASKDALKAVVASGDVDDESEEEEPVVPSNEDALTKSSTSKKKKSKKAKLKKALGGGSKDAEAESSKNSSNPASKLTDGMVEQLLEMNPALKSEVSGMSKEKAAETLKKLDVAHLLSGMVRNPTMW